MLAYIVAAIFGPPMILLVHEIGHLTAARWCSVRVIGISVGWGAELFEFSDRHGTRWSIAALPVAGCIKFLDNGEADSLSSKSLWSRAIIYSAGPLANFVLALFISCVAALVFGETVLPGAYSDQTPVLIASMLSFLSILVGAFNLLPIPPLDGASLSFLATEAITGKPISDGTRKNALIGGIIGLCGLTIASVGLVIHRVGAYYF